jgi:NAD(P)-dependent dehydrogenase (short-subunit alcohol dehydrogenase family)
MIKTVLITGANRGLGLEFARQYALDEWQVLACCRDPKKAEQLQKLSTQYNNITIYKLDVTKETEITKLTETLDKMPIDLLINNAGIYGDKASTLERLSTQELNKVFLTNTIAPLLISRALSNNLMLGQMKVIATISSLMGSISNNNSGGSYAYRASKSALNMIMKNLSIDYKTKGIHVLVLHPGWVKTDMGGEQAPLDINTSITGMRKVILEQAKKNQGLFYSYDGEEISW